MMLWRWFTAVAMALVLVLVPVPCQAYAAETPPGITLSGVDSHDGLVYSDGGGYYWVGTRYGCGFVWGRANTPWCGFGVWRASGPAGPWTYVRDLFDPAGNSAPAYLRESWQTICRGGGCFNPRMIKRPDGGWVLWFSGDNDYTRYRGNRFWALGCNGPTGPCGAAAGPPYGSTVKPGMWFCNVGGDYSILTEGADAWLVCSQNNILAVERLGPSWTDGSATGATNLAGLSYVEGVGLARLADGTYLMTYGDNCPYCSATDTSYAVASNPIGPWRVPAGVRARARIDGRSCGGQPRTLTTLDGQVYQQIDLWYDSRNEAAAGTRLEPLIATGAPYLPAPDGTVQVGPFRPFACR